MFFSFSDDKGVTWTQVPISTITGEVEFRPDIDVGEDGRVGVMCYRGVPGTTTHPTVPGLLATTFVDTYLSVSSDGGASFEPAIRVSANTSNWRITYSNIVPNFGDYNTVEWRGSRVFCTWAGNDEVVTIDGQQRQVPAVMFAEVSQVVGKNAQAVIRYTEMPNEFALGQNHPNPFNPETNITYDLPRSSHVSLKILDVTGREVAVLSDGEQPAGKYRVPFTASHLPSGMYFYKLAAGDYVAVKKMLVQK